MEIAQKCTKLVLFLFLMEIKQVEKLSLHRLVRLSLNGSSPSFLQRNVIARDSIYCASKRLFLFLRKRHAKSACGRGQTSAAPQELRLTRATKKASAAYSAFLLSERDKPIRLSAYDGRVEDL
ncbi:MAG: hypothetical protein D6691_05005 [Candidatus Hydrogenedentota bacterium]|jgi:hypothetical protein|nr:MAG: hypothetical protein D6691_05005 [Candidatus Hydrogenedentota bacterium]